MLTFAYPILFALIPLPLVVFLLAPPHREPRIALVVPFLDRLANQSGAKATAASLVPHGGWLRRLALSVSWIFAVGALARPQIVEPPIYKSVPVRDMLLAVDLSGSMATEDFKNSSGKRVDRLTAVKEVLDDFLAHRQGDRVGLLFFGSAPFVQAPFTEDLKLCRQLLDEAQVNMAGPQTVFGDALGLAITLFDKSSVKERVIIALTDGNDTASSVPPLKAAEIAKNKGIVVHTVAVGDPKAAGEDALDVESLQQVAASTGGIYSYAADTQQLNEIYRSLDKLETRQAQSISFRPRRDVYWWFLLAGFGVTLLQQCVQLLLHWQRRRFGSPEDFTNDHSVQSGSSSESAREVVA